MDATRLRARFREGQAGGVHMQVFEHVDVFNGRDSTS